MTEPLTLPEPAEDPPAGPNMEQHADFLELERTAQGKPETQYGNVVEAAVPPDWKLTADMAGAMLERTRDLRVMALLTIAQTNLVGFPGYAEGLATIRHHLETMWEHVHPQLDPEDDNDPMQRSNTLQALQDRVLRAMRDLPLATTPRTGPVAWRDLAVLHGSLEPEPGRERMSEAAVRAAFAGTDKARLALLTGSIDGALADLAAIPAAFDAQAGAGTGPDYQNSIKLLRDIRKELTRFEALAEDSAERAAESEAPEPAGDGGGDAGPAAPRGRGAASIQGISSLSNREDALHALELAAGYFRSNEPSSPLPLLIDRAKRLATLDFLEILRDMAPDGVMQAQIVTGVTPE